MASGDGDSCATCCCKCSCKLIIGVGVIALTVWLTLRVSNPSCSVQIFDVPGLNRTLATPSNTTVFVSLRLANSNKDKGINYDNVNLTLSYLRNESNPNSTVRIAESTIVKFYQGHKKKATKHANFSGGGFNWSEVRDRVFGDNKTTAYFRVDLVTAVRFKIWGWRTKRHMIRVGGKVPVNYLGTKVNKKGEPDKKRIKLSSGNRDAGFGLRFGVLVSFGTWVLMGLW